jgi:hypothetical protein
MAEELAAHDGPGLYSNTRVERQLSGAHDVVVGRQLVRPAALNGAWFAALRALQPLRPTFGWQWPVPYSVRPLRRIPVRKMVLVLQL